MTQPAKSQEPSMEEILASIRRIIADDDAAKRLRPLRNRHGRRRGRRRRRRDRSRRRPRRHHLRLSRSSPRRPKYMLHPPTRPLGDEGVKDNASDILALTESMEAPSFSQAAPSPTPGPTPQFRKIEALSGREFRRIGAKTSHATDGGAHCACFRAKAASRAAFERNKCGGRFRIQHAGANGAGKERSHARGFGARDVAAVAEVMARRQSAGHGRTLGACRDRACRARTLVRMIRKGARVDRILAIDRGWSLVFRQILRYNRIERELVIRFTFEPDQGLARSHALDRGRDSLRVVGEHRCSSLKLAAGLSDTPILRGMTWICRWNTTWPPAGSLNC